MKTGQHKSWLSPFVAVIFGAVATSGILMLFHFKVPGLRSIHEWGGIAFVAAILVHLILNWNLFVSYFRNSKAAIGAMAGALVIILAVCITPQEPDDFHADGHERHGNERTAHRSWR